MKYFLVPKNKNILQRTLRNIRHRILMLCVQKLSFLHQKILTINRSVKNLIYQDRLFQSGANDFFMKDYLVFKIDQDTGDPVIFPPQVVMEVKALACELPKELGLPFSRLSCNDIAREAVKRGIAASISGTTIWRWLSNDAIRPWSYRSWIFPRDRNFSEKAGNVLDLYHGQLLGEPLGKDDYVISADEKTSIQVRKRIHSGTATGPKQIRRVEFEYQRGGALAYLAAWDVHRAKVFGICEKKSGIKAYHNLIDIVMKQEPYRSAHRVFWITDNGSSHRGENSKIRLAQWYPNAIQIHTPVHASWLNQIEIYFSIVQRKVLTPNEFQNLDEIENNLLNFQKCYEKIAKPFEWKFTRKDLTKLLEKLSKYEKVINIERAA